MGKSGIFFFRCVCWFENWNWRSWVVFPYPPSVAKFYPVNRTNHAKQSEKQKDSAAWTAKWGVPLYLAAPSWNTCAFYAARHRRPPSNCWPSLGLWKKKMVIDVPSTPMANAHLRKYTWLYEHTSNFPQSCSQMLLKHISKARAGQIVLGMENVHLQ